MVGVDAEGPECIENGGLRVDPGNPDNSLLMNKINGGDVVCGTNMPITGMLEPDQIDRIRTWIADGAAND